MEGSANPNNSNTKRRGGTITLAAHGYVGFAPDRCIGILKLFISLITKVRLAHTYCHRHVYLFTTNYKTIYT